MESWDFYSLAPHSSKKEPAAVYLRLVNKHYEWLKPFCEISAATTKQWLEHAAAKPEGATLPGLQGGGNEDR